MNLDSIHIYYGDDTPEEKLAYFESRTQTEVTAGEIGYIVKSIGGTDNKNDPPSIYLSTVFILRREKNEHSSDQSEI